MRLGSCGIIAICFLALIQRVGSLTTDSNRDKRSFNSFHPDRKKSEIVEGSAEPPKYFGQLNSPDLEVRGSGNGYSADDEDGDVIEGSGGLEVEGSSGDLSPHLRPMPQPKVTTTLTTTVTTTTRVPVTTREPIFHHVETVAPRQDFEIVDATTPTTTVTTTKVTSTSTRPVAIPPLGDEDSRSPFSFLNVLGPGTIAASIGGAVVGVLSTVLLVMFIIHRMRKKDEGSYALDEPKPRPYGSYAYTKASTKDREFYA